MQNIPRSSVFQRSETHKYNSNLEEKYAKLKTLMEG